MPAERQANRAHAAHYDFFYHHVATRLRLLHAGKDVLRCDAAVHLQPHRIRLHHVVELFLRKGHQQSEAARANAERPAVPHVEYERLDRIGALFAIYAQQYETVEKDHGRIEVRRYFAFEQLECLADPQQWPGLTMFGVVQSERTLKGKTSLEERLYIGSIPVQARRFAHAVRSHWEVENRLHWCLDVCLNDDQARARVRNSARNLATVRRMVLNILRLDKSRKGGIKTRRMLAGTSDRYREQLLGLVASAI